MTLTQEVSWTKYIASIPQRKPMEFKDEELPVLFYQSDGDNVVLVEYDNKNISVFEEAYVGKNKPVNEEKILKEIKDYIKDLGVNKIDLLIDKSKSEIIYDLTNKTITDYSNVDELPPKQVSKILLFTFGPLNDFNPVPANMYPYGGTDTALYVRAYSKYLLKPKKVETSGSLFVASLFAGYFEMTEMNSEKAIWAVNPDKSNSRFTEVQLEKLDSFREGLKEKDVLGDDKEKKKTVDETPELGNGPITLTQIKNLKRIPYFILNRTIVNDQNIWASYIKEMTITTGVLRVMLKSQSDFRIVTRFGVATFLGVPEKDVIICIDGKYKEVQ
jgi:hypothetical protein